MKYFMFLLPFVLLTGCVSNSERYYRGKSIPGDHEQVVELIQAESRDEAISIARQRKASGMLVLGTSNFIGPHETPHTMESFAKKLNASTVVFYGGIREHRQGANPVILQGPDQTVTSSTVGNVYGSEGQAFYNGTTTTTVPGGYTQVYVPYSHDVYETHEIFLGQKP